jgi:hypothetical protein
MKTMSTFLFLPETRYHTISHFFFNKNYTLKPSSFIRVCLSFVIVTEYTFPLRWITFQSVNKIQGGTEKSAFIPTGNSSRQLQQCFLKFFGICKIELPFVPPLFWRAVHVECNFINLKTFLNRNRKNWMFLFPSYCIWWIKWFHFRLCFFFIIAVFLECHEKLLQLRLMNKKISLLFFVTSLFCFFIKCS